MSEASPLGQRTKGNNRLVSGESSVSVGNLFDSV